MGESESERMKMKTVRQTSSDKLFPILYVVEFNHEMLQAQKFMVGHLFQNYDTIYVRFFPRILAFFPALWVFYSQVYVYFLTNAHIYAHQKRPCIWFTNKRVYGVTAGRRIRGIKIVPLAINHFMYDEAEK